jgi:hypothetical protein
MRQCGRLAWVHPGCFDKTILANKAITEAALASYAATASEGAGSLTDPHVAFAFTYLASHFARNLLTEQQVAELMDLHRASSGDAELTTFAVWDQSSLG